MADEISLNEQYQDAVLENSALLRDAIRTIDCIADINTSKEQCCASKYCYEEQNNEFRPYRCFGVFFIEDRLWDHFYDAVVLNRCWHLASHACFHDVTHCHSDLCEVVRSFMPIAMKLYVLRGLVGWLKATDRDPLNLGHILYNLNEYVNDVLGADKDFKRHVVCHYIYFFYIRSHIR